MKIHQKMLARPLVQASLTLALVSLIGCGGSSGGSKPASSSSSVATSAAVSSSSADASSSDSSAVVESSSSVTESSSSTPASSSAPASSSVASSNGWELVWSDEFDGTSVDTSKWSYEQNCWGGGNNEQQCYTNRPDNSFVADGVLNIVAKREDFTGPDSPEGDGSGTKTLPYTSARLRTKNIQEWTFGRFEIRAKLPFGQGTWPAIWMLPTDSPYGTWASSGEIDIMEAVNLKTVTDGGAPEAAVHGTLHYGRNWPDNVQSGAAYLLPNNANPADDFHEYAVEWEEGEIRWYVDGVHFATQRDTGWYGQYRVDGVLTDAPVGAPFDRFSQFHLLLNLAVGGNWAGNVNNKGIDESVFPQTLQVDYVRVYQCSVSPADGKGCATLGENATLVEGNERPIIGAVDLPGPPLFVMYDDELAAGLRFDSYTTAAGQISYSEVDEAGRGKVLNIVKTGTTGNVYFKVAGDPTDMRNWSADSELIFDVKVNSKADGANLLVKIDSGWPKVSDVVVPVANNGEWKEFRITLADLIADGNSIEPGKATLASIVNTFVVDPTNAMDVSFDNIRIEGSASSGVDEFASLPLFTLYDNSLAAGLQVQSFNPAGQITASEVDEVDHGKVFKVVKTGAQGNVFFNVVNAPVDLSHWSANGELVFTFKVNSKAVDTELLIKMDSGWPNVSDVKVPLPVDGVWTEYRIAIADLIDNGNSNSCCPGAAALDAITNMFVMEPTGAIDIVFDNIRFVASGDYSIYDDAPNAELNIQSYNPNGLVSTSSVTETDRGNVFRVVKTAGGEGNAFFSNTAGARDISDWLNAELVFDYKINSYDTGAYLLIKMDSGWPKVSDVEITPSTNTDWQEYRVSVADLINNGNHYTSQADKANPQQLLNLFVIEPQGAAMDVSFDNVRIVLE